eukprot:507264-Pleurochrysis_carterae.AAC.1
MWDGGGHKETQRQEANRQRQGIHAAYKLPFAEIHCQMFHHSKYLFCVTCLCCLSCSFLSIILRARKGGFPDCAENSRSGEWGVLNRRASAHEGLLKNIGQTRHPLS